MQWLEGTHILGTDRHLLPSHVLIWAICIAVHSQVVHVRQYQQDKIHCSYVWLWRPVTESFIMWLPQAHCALQVKSGITEHSGMYWQ